jgi:flagellar basal body-associated protein FliL
LDDILNAPAQEIVEKVEEIETPAVQESIAVETIIPENKIEEEPKKPVDEPIIEFLDVPATATPDPVATRTPFAEKVQVENSYIPKKNPLVSKEIKATISQIKEPKEESKTETKAEVKPETKGKEKTAEAKPKKEKVVKPKKKRGAFFWILIVLLGLGFTGGILTFMFYDQVKKYIPFIDNTETKEQKRLSSDTIESLNNSAEELEAAESERINAESNTETPVEEEIPSEAIPVETNQKPEKVEAAPIASSSSGSYHVIVGAFSVQANAERFAQKQGGSTSVIPQGSMYLVSLSSYTTRAEANQAMDNLDKAWILKKD